MRREDFTLTVRGPGDGDGESATPALVVEYDGPPGEITPRLEGPEGDPLEDDQTDVSFRFTTDVDADDAGGVLGLTDRVTGDFVFELNADADDVLSFVREARRTGEPDGGDGQYRVHVVADGETLATYDKATFLVYNSDGDLLRDCSLIPGGVEL